MNSISASRPATQLHDPTSRTLDAFGQIAAAAPPDPFEGRMRFPTLREAHVAAMRLVHHRMMREGGTNEFGYEVERRGDAYVLGRLIRGDARQIDTQTSLWDAWQQRKLRETHQSGGHSHPLNDFGVPPAFSQADLRVLGRSEPINGWRSEALYDFTNGTVHLVRLRADAVLPPEIGIPRPSGAEIARLKGWIENEIAQKRLQVELVDMHRPGRVPTNFDFGIAEGLVGETTVRVRDLRPAAPLPSQPPTPRQRREPRERPERPERPDR